MVVQCGVDRSRDEARDIVKRISREAERRSVSFGLDREGAEHTVYRIGTTINPIPRHREVDECETELGKGWWRT
ncbi:hypothetical protein AD006_11315 [Pseudonocardia sp. EC080610-09]|nr:hypothetical protein AD006_11315 [Pseudonocardia sp. EC080610-09]ALL82772.1 hypothetical protein AD017_19145 [Pseudonocardia sp. EC080619-01]